MKQRILNAALQLAREHGYSNIDRGQIAERVPCSRGSINYYFNTINQLQRAVLGEAIRVTDLTIIAQALMRNETRALKLPDSVKRAAVGSLLNENHDI